MEEQKNVKPRRLNRTTKLAIVIAAALLACSSLLERLYMTGIMKLEIAALNMDTPKWQDDLTRLDSVTMKKKVLTYFCSVDIAEFEITVHAFVENKKEHLTDFISTNYDLRYLRRKKITFVYNYHDMEGRPVYEFRIPPEVYKNKKKWPKMY